MYPLFYLLPFLKELLPNTATHYTSISRMVVSLGDRLLLIEVLKFNEIPFFQLYHHELYRASMVVLRPNAQ